MIYVLKKYSPLLLILSLYIIGLLSSHIHSTTHHTSLSHPLSFSKQRVVKSLKCKETEINHNHAPKINGNITVIETEEYKSVKFKKHFKKKNKLEAFQSSSSFNDILIYCFFSNYSSVSRLVLFCVFKI